MSQAELQCHLDIDRGPDWLFIRLRLPPTDLLDAVPVAEPIWNVVDQYHLYRVVLELDQISLLHSYLIGQLVLLQKRLHTHDGVLRVCGLSPGNENVLHTARMDAYLPNYANRGDAVMGYRKEG
jgi:hypothetical protein